MLNSVAHTDSQLQRQQIGDLESLDEPPDLTIELQ
jgi:hypothetical protein